MLRTARCRDPAEVSLSGASCDTRMNYPLVITLSGLCLLSMLIERLGVPTTLELHFKGDVKRETRWLAQYGQGVCTLVAALLAWRLDRSPPHKDAPWALIIAVLAASLIATLIN